nr:tripartite tricarboxylate transporter substrate binding protein [Pseudomonas sp.]
MAVSRRTLLKLPLAASLFGVGSAVHASEPYPSRPIRVIVSASPGTSMDTAARFLAAAIGASEGTTFVVENKVGANGIIATEHVARAAPDGYTLLFTASTHYTNRWMQESLPYDVIEDFAPIARVANGPLVLVVPADSEARTVADLIRIMKASPGEVTYASAGNGSTTHLSAVLFNSLAGTTARHVPYKGAAQALTDTIGGQVAFTFAGTSTCLPQIKAGRLRALGVTSNSRVEQLPEVPAIAEAGLEGYELTSWLGALAPAGTPPEIINKQSKLWTDAANSQEFKDFCIAQGFQHDILDAAEFQANAAKDLEKWRKIVLLSRE